MTNYTIDTEHLPAFAAVELDGELVADFYGPDAVANARLFAAAGGLLEALKAQEEADAMREKAERLLAETKDFHAWTIAKMQHLDMTRAARKLRQAAIAAAEANDD